MKDYKNYFDHEVKVKAIDGILSHSQEWEWLVDYVENNFNLEDIKSWDEYWHKYRRLYELLTLVIKIVDIEAVEIHSTVDVFRDIINIAKFYIGELKQSECKALVSSNFGQILHFAVWVTKVENASNETEYVVDYGLFTYKNYWQLVNVESMDIFSDALEELSAMNIEGWDSISKVFTDNIHSVLYGYDEDLFDRVGSKVFNANIFNYQDITLNSVCTW